MEDIELHPEDDEGHTGDPGEPPLCGQVERIDHEEEDGNELLLQTEWFASY